MRKLSKFLFLPFGLKRLFIQTYLLVWIIRLCLWIFPFRKLNNWLSYFEIGKTVKNNNNWVTVEEVVRSVRFCSRYVPLATCLTQALAARALLYSNGQSCQLKIGVDKRKDNKLAAHAWLEIEGQIIIGKVSRHKRFKVLTPSPSGVL